MQGIETGGKTPVVFQCTFEIKFTDTANLKQIAASNLMYVFINTKYIYKDYINPCQPNSQVRVMQVALRADTNCRPTPPLKLEYISKSVWVVCIGKNRF